MDRLPLRVNSNERYAGCANEAFKNFLRLHVDRTGLSVYPIGIRLPTGWTFDSDVPHETPATVGFSRAIRSTRARIGCRVGGRLGRRLG